ncbi:hypothetical protein BGZ73_007535 [Actinomortierella ambigua]|nr:hypothetical protein BGZ73_007535 [Actinomortierella ambigua]
MSIARQNFSEQAESSINQQVNLQLAAAQTFRQVAAYFSQTDVALPGLSKNFHKRACKETEKAQYWIHYQNERGGTVVLDTIPAPNLEWGSAREALGKFSIVKLDTKFQTDLRGGGRDDLRQQQLFAGIQKRVMWPHRAIVGGVPKDAALQIERDVNKNFLAVSALADNNDDPQLSNTVRSTALAQQVDSIEELAHLITQHDRTGSGLGLYLFDKNLENDD